MKKLFLLITLALIVQFELFCQTELGMYAGVDNGKLSGDKLPNTKYSAKTGLILGLTVDVTFNDIVSLSFQPGMIKTGSKIQVPDTVENEYKDSVQISVDYLVLPVYVKVQSKSKRLYFFSGLEFGYGLSLKVENDEEEIDITDELNKWNISLTFGLGYKIPIKKSFLYFELRYAQGLINIAKSDPEDNYYLPRVKLSGLKIITGFQIPVSKRKK